MNKKIFKDNLKKIMALLLVFAMTMPLNLSVFADDNTAPSGGITREDEEAREKECMNGNADYLKKFLTYLSLKYPKIGIDPQYGTGVNPNIADQTDDLYNWFNATKMARQTEYNRQWCRYVFHDIST